ncbi:hypothetical protein BVC93_03600 [Mycobacterium sp. MS1601]|uniref:hypothetical protein n=1 Tax=Mycobacterium sp. MS1601 TaxID=1936029 RepID=UPI0009792242|nr:hypothetical protein [Mycobacterium sp. MS1601]AQA01665.1 hypothetical protein BVC93_03600 [Mycobacterium sp. MS1601]
MNFKSAMVTGVVGASLMLTAGLGVAQAAGPDGEVNVVVGGATVLDSVPDAQAAQAAASMCAVPEPALDAIASQVDNTGGSQTACTGHPGGAVVLAQNLPAAMELSPVVPGTKASWGSGEAAAVPSGPDPISSSLPTSPDNMSSEN